MKALERKALEDSVMDFMLAQGYSGDVLETKYNEEVERLIREADNQEQSKSSKQKSRSKPKSKSTIPEDERQRMVEELIINDFGARNSVSRWQDKRLKEEYNALLEWKKKFPNDFKAFDPQALTVKSTRTSLSKPKPTSTSQPAKTYTIMIPSTNQQSSLPASGNLAIQQHMTRSFDVHTELDEDEKILITEPYNPEDVGVMESTYTRGSSRPKRKILQLPTTTKQPKSSVTITEINPSTASTAPLKQLPPPTTQSKQIIKSSSQRQSRIVKWSVDKKTNWMMLTRENGLTAIYKNWHDLLGLSEYDHRTLINMNIEGEDSMSKAKEFELEFKGQLWQKFYGDK